VADPRPRLVATPPEPEPPGSDASAAASAPAAAGVSRRIVGVVVLVAVLLGVALAVQSQRVGELGAQVDGLTIELQAAQAALAAHERRMVRVRASVDDLQARMVDLGNLVNAPSAAPPPPETP
jgi:uncharacterized coiled-coil protein SlyX